MKQLELKHLACYLPYNLNCLVEFTVHGKIVEPLVGIKHNNFYVGGKKIDVDTWDFKPILRPLSDLTKEMYYSLSVKTETRSFGFWYGKNNGDTDKREYLYHSGYSDKTYFLENNGYEHFSYRMIEFLLKNHFDIFGLIDQDLAININTL